MLHQSGRNSHKTGQQSPAPPAPGRGTSPKSKFERYIKPGHFLFLEGDSGTEMYIIKRGQVKILKQEGARMVELVTLGPGAVLGEMCLLDNAPRSASAKAVSDLYVTVIDQNHLSATLSKVPSWLNSIIKIVVQRLRETTARNYRDILRNGVGAVLRTIMHLERHGAVRDGTVYFIPVEQIKDGVYSIFGLSCADAEKILRYLQEINLCSRQKNKTGREFLKFEDVETVQLFYEHLKTRQAGKPSLADEISIPAADLAGNIVEAGESRGTRRDDTVSVDVKQVLLHMQQKGEESRDVDEELLLELKKFSLIQLQQKQTATEHSSYQRQLISYKSLGLPRFVKSCKWKDAFNLDINEVILT